MSTNLPASQSETESPEATKVNRRAKRHRQVQRVLQILGLPVGGIGLAPTVMWLQQGKLLLAALTGFASVGVIVLAVTYTFLAELTNRVLDRIEQRLEATTDPFAEGWKLGLM